MSIRESNETKKQMLQWLRGENLDLDRDELIERVKRMPDFDTIVKVMMIAREQCSSRLLVVKTTHGKAQHEKAMGVMSETFNQIERQMIDKLFDGDATKNSEDWKDYITAMGETMQEM